MINVLPPFLPSNRKLRSSIASCLATMYKNNTQSKRKNECTYQTKLSAFIELLN